MRIKPTASSRRNRLGIGIVLFCITVAPVTVSAEQFQISLKSGSVLTVEVGDPVIQWTNVLLDGRMQQRDLRLRDVQQLVLSESPASKQVAQIRQYLQQLESPEYRLRQLAEEKLSDRSFSGQFLSMIKAESAHAKLEVRYRIGRILESLEDTKVEAINEFDHLILVDGTELEGDAGELKLNCEYRQRTVSFEREDIGYISRPVELPIDKTTTDRVEVQMFHQHDEHFYQAGQTVIDFEKSPGGDDLSRNINVSEMFVSKGLLLGSETPGFVGISGYGFKFPLPPKDNSVCVFETVGSYSKRFKGVMELRFCLPNQPAVMAGVHEIGLFVARVNHSRDFIVEAYNAQGQVLATVEASDMGCIFAGIKTTEPITFVRILPNPYLFRLTRKIDEDFAVDHICFSTPVPVSSVAQLQQNVVQLKNGDVLNGESLISTSNAIDVELKAFGGSIQLPIKDIRSVQFESLPKQVTTSQRNWFAMLPDRSVIDVRPGAKFASRLFEGVKFEPDQLSALWYGSNKTRFPTLGDFDKGNYVVVFPTARIATEKMDFQSTGYRWNKAVKIEQELNLSKSADEAKEDPTPNITEVDYAKTSPENIPMIWLKPPNQRAPGTGLIRLTDGQQLVLKGGENDRGGFRLSSLDEAAITVAIDDQRQIIPLGRILSIEFPDE